MDLLAFGKPQRFSNTYGYRPPPWQWPQGALKDYSITPESFCTVTMRFFFNLVSADETLIDDEGVDVKDSDQAWTQALKAIAELREEAGGEVMDWEKWRLEAIDPSGEVVFSIKLTYGLH